MLATTTCFTLGARQRLLQRVAKFSSTMMASAPESLSWNSSSRGVYSGLTFTTVQPARRMAAIATGYCSTFGIMMATRAPRSQALALQPGGEGARRLVELAIGHGLVHADEDALRRDSPGSFPRTSRPATDSATGRSRRARPADSAAARVVPWRFPLAAGLFSGMAGASRGAISISRTAIGRARADDVS